MTSRLAVPRHVVAAAPARVMMLVGIVAMTACLGGKSATGVPSEFTVRVDSITGSNAVSGGVAADALLWGTVGPGGCTSFKGLRTTRVPSQIDVTVIGERTEGAACLSSSVVLKGEILRLEPLIPYNFLIVVHQPDGSTLVRRIYGE